MFGKVIADIRHHALSTLWRSCDANLAPVPDHIDMKREHRLTVRGQARLVDMLNTGGVFLTIRGPNPFAHAFDVGIHWLRRHPECKQQYAGSGFVSDTANCGELRTCLRNWQCGQRVQIGIAELTQSCLNRGCLLSRQTGESDRVGNVLHLRIFDRAPGWKLRSQLGVCLGGAHVSRVLRENRLHQFTNWVSGWIDKRMAVVLTEPFPNDIDFPANLFRKRACMFHTRIVRELTGALISQDTTGRYSVVRHRSKDLLDGNR